MKVTACFFRSTLAAAAATLVLTGPALATPTVALSALEALGSTGPGSDVMNPLLANGGDFFRSAYAGVDSSFFHTYGFTSALSYFGARVSGTGTFFGRTSATYVDSFSNTGSTALSLVFNFHVDSGQVALYGTGTGYSDLALTLDINTGSGATTLASSHGRIDYDSSAGSSCSVSGSGVLASYLNCDGGVTASSASGSGGAHSVSLLLGAGQTLQLTYSIVAEVAGTLDASEAVTECIGGLKDGQGEPTLQALNDGVELGEAGYYSCVSLNGISRSGDPAGLFAPANFSLTATAVPEPAALALVGLALASALGASRRRRS